MYKNRIIISALLSSIAFGDYDYALEDINSSSAYYQQNVGTSYFPNQITLHYFGHYN